MTVTTPAPTTAEPVGRILAGRLLLTVLLAVCALVAVSTAFSDDPFPAAAVVLIASFGVLAAAFGAALVWWGGRARVALWALPVFFVVHVAALGTWLPDAVFAVLAALGALLTTPGRR